jgi:hypothetical protein
VGCDIHVYVEKKDGHGIWQLLPDPTNYDDWGLNRNYSTFGLLAGIRDYDVPPIREPRGLPKDISEGLKENRRRGSADEWAFGETWYLLSELLNHDWDTPVPTRYGGKTSPREFVDPAFFTLLSFLDRNCSPWWVDKGRDNIRLLIWFDN